MALTVRDGPECLKPADKPEFLELPIHSKLNGYIFRNRPPSSAGQASPLDGVERALDDHRFADEARFVQRFNRAGFFAGIDQLLQFFIEKPGQFA